MKILFKFLLVVFLFTFASCASYYRSISPTSINYPAQKYVDPVELTYRYDVLREAGNKKYVKNEFKSRTKIVAVKITNNTNQTISVSNDLSFYCGDHEISLLSPTMTKGRIQQSAPAYSLYLIGCASLAPLDIIVFGGIGVGNMVVASKANKNLLNELLKYDIVDKEIEKGESLIGIISFESPYADPISVKIHPNQI